MLCYVVCLVLSVLQAAAQEGIPPAIYNLGNMYASGVGVKQSDESARACYEGAAG